MYALFGTSFGQLAGVPLRAQEPSVSIANFTERRGRSMLATGKGKSDHV
jgi:hypothetical protein